MRDDLHTRAVDAFIAAANESDDGRRAGLLDRALTPDIVFWGPLGRRVGRKAVDGFLAEVVQRHPAAPCRLVRTTRVDAPEEWARFGWRYEANDGRSLLSGVDMVHVTPGGGIDHFVVFAGALE
ncbi:nuclear transport factor 2 family protein [Actinomadura chibensis]|uniref:Nuclear transport factor 2 family protein n=1 Tax=Actinomadura chibensis TaxID=392828 RepID=A0A5D0NMK8_9ACTN|nr:nuclear transport factor 2 family protein [Actinomadura chibensis]TYB45508.1 nuclear transport factor 2 family protein [Actinomadura chibensis]